MKGRVGKAVFVAMSVVTRVLSGSHKGFQSFEKDALCFRLLGIVARGVVAVVMHAFRRYKVG